MYIKWAFVVVWNKSLYQSKRQKLIALKIFITYKFNVTKKIYTRTRYFLYCEKTYKENKAFWKKTIQYVPFYLSFQLYYNEANFDKKNKMHVIRDLNL